MTKSVLLYGNCQLGGVFAVINLINCKYEHIICHKTQLTESEFEQKLQNCDILITQNIADNYRGKNYLGTNWAIKKCLSTTPIVIVDTCYFKTYFYDFINSPSWAMSVSTYCYKSMIDYIINNKTIDEYIDEVVNNENHISKSRVFEFLKADIDELNRRANYCEKRYGIHPNVKFIHVANFIENNFDKQVLFHSVNHPSAVLLGHIASELLLIIGIKATFKKGIDPLGAEKCILYKSLKSCVDFDLREPSLVDKKVGLKLVCQRYWDAWNLVKTNN